MGSRAQSPRAGNGRASWPKESESNDPAGVMIMILARPAAGADLHPRTLDGSPYPRILLVSAPSFRGRDVVRRRPLRRKCLFSSDVRPRRRPMNPVVSLTVLARRLAVCRVAYAAVMKRPGSLPVFVTCDGERFRMHSQEFDVAGGGSGPSDVLVNPETAARPSHSHGTAVAPSELDQPLRRRRSNRIRTPRRRRGLVRGHSCRIGRHLL